VEMLLYVAIYATAGATVLMLLVVFFFLVGARLRLTGRYSQVQLLYSATRLFKVIWEQAVSEGITLRGGEFSVNPASRVHRNIINVIRYLAAVMRPLAASTAATCSF